MDPKWLEWTKRLQAIAQCGLTFTKDPYDAERYEQIRILAAEIAADHTDADQEKILGLFRSELGYATPKLDVRGAIFRDNGILMVKERREGLWSLPGGFVDIGDSPSEAVIREIREESGYEARAIKLIGVYDRGKHDYPPSEYHYYKLFFECELIGGNPTANLEVSEIGFFEENNLPPLSLTHITLGQITRLFEHHRHPDWPTDYD